MTKTTTGIPPHYKQTQLGWIPEEWEVARFKKIAEFNPKSDILPDTFTYIDLESVKGGVLQKRNVIHKKDAPSRAQRLLEKNDVLFQTVRPYQKNNLFFEEEGNFVASTGYAQIRAKKCSGFIFHLIHATYFNNQVLARCTGTSFPAISSNDLSKVLIKLPPLPEQQKIAAILSTWDRAITQQQQLIAAKQQFKKGLMQRLLTGKQRFAGFEGEWEEVKVKDVAEIKRGAGSQYITYTEKENSNSIRLIRITDFLSNDPKYIIKTPHIDRFILKKGDLLIAGTGATAGITFEIPQIFEGKAYSYNAPRIRTKSKILKEFLIYYLKSNAILRQQHALFTGNAQPFLDTKAIGGFKIMLPQIKEQQKIASVLRAADKEIALLQKQLTQLQTQKRGLMQRLLTGAVRVEI